MTTVASGGSKSTQPGQDYGEMTAGLTATIGFGAPPSTRTPVLLIRPIFVLMLAVLSLILAAALAGCIETGSPGTAGNNGQAEEIPGVPNVGSPPPEIPGVDPTGTPPPGEGEEIPGVPPPVKPPASPPPPSTLPAKATVLLTEAVKLETAEIQADPPPDADARLTFLKSLPSSQPEKVSSLKSYDWGSRSAADKFDEAVALIADGQSQEESPLPGPPGGDNDRK